MFPNTAKSVVLSSWKATQRALTWRWQFTTTVWELSEFANCLHHV